MSTSFTNYPGGVTSVGMPLTGVPYAGPLGRVFYVTSSAAKYNELINRIGRFNEFGQDLVYLQNTTNNGIQGAIDSCRSGRGDVIMIEPGYYLVSTTINVNKSHVTFYARGDNRVQTVLFGGAAGFTVWTSNLFNVTGSSSGYSRFVGLSLYTYNATGYAILLSDAPGGGDNGGFCEIINCTFPPEGGGVDSELAGIGIKGANNVTIKGCEFLGQAQAGILWVAGGVGHSVNPRISRCKFTGCVSGIEVPAITDVFNAVVDNCWFGTSASPTSQSMSQGLLQGAGAAGEFNFYQCFGQLSAGNFVQGAGGITLYGDTSGGYTALT